MRHKFHIENIIKNKIADLVARDSRYRYVILNDTDCPERKMVCQFVDGIGYCYLNRDPILARHDGMVSYRPTPMADFGFAVTDMPDGIVKFSQVSSPCATYEDGAPRRWQGRATEFEFDMLVKGKGKKPVPMRLAKPSNPSLELEKMGDAAKDQMSPSP
jgi:hypothetical protein